MKEKLKLGKGFGALMSENAVDFEDSSEKLIRVSDIEPNTSQPRKEFDTEKLSELAKSICEHGIISPIIVREIEGGRYQIIAGERRWRAARIAGVAEVPVLIRTYSDKEVMEVALIENIQREDLSIVEIAKGYTKLMDEFSLTQEDVAKKVGKSRSAVANIIRILNLPSDILKLIEMGDLSFGHGKVLLSIEDEDLLKKAAKATIKNNFTVRELENFIKSLNKEKPKKLEKDIYIKDLESKISSSIGAKVNIVNGKKKGKIEIEYYSKDDLNTICDFLLK